MNVTSERIPNGPFDRFKRQRAVLLTSYKRDGTPVPTPVSIAVEDDHAYFRTYDKSWKARRLRNDRRVMVAPSTMSGRATGTPIPATAVKLDGNEADHAAKLLGKKYRLLHGVFVPLLHKLRGYKTLHYELKAA